MILSASRRTDIPSFYSEWLVSRLRAGEVLVRNPMNHAQVSRISLSPEIVDCIVFWTKDPQPMLARLPQIEALGYRFYFQFTLTPYGRELEPGLRPKEALVETLQQLSEAIGPERVLWRYDPIVLNEDWTPARHVQAFEALCRQVAGRTRVCTISFVDSYGKLRGAYRSGLLRDITQEEMLTLAAAFARIGSQYGMELRACCEALDLASCGVHRGSCIDRAVVERLCGYPIHEKPDGNQRPGCGCISSVDIGAYDTCRHGCAYCYATRSSRAVHQNCGRHNSASPLLVGTLSPDDIVHNRIGKSSRDTECQMKLF